jgi:hypothetical protein
MEDHAMSRTLILALTLATLSSRAVATPIRYVMTTTATGKLGDTTFTDRIVTFTATADTANVVAIPPQVLAAPALTSTVDVAGIGSGSFTGASFVLLHTVNWYGGLWSGTIAAPGDLILIEFVSAFDSYRLQTSIGPEPGLIAPNPNVSYSPNTSFATTAGDLTIS